MLPPGADGILVILENTCDQQYTYWVDGTEANFFGHGDLHDSKYDYLQTGATLDSLVDGVETETTEAGCEYSIRVYPSDSFEDRYQTDRPWIHATVLAGLFVFTSAVFLLYDAMVQRRQKIVMESAIQSGTLVSSLFPEAVRQKLYEEHQERVKAKDARKAWKSGKNDNIDHSTNENKAAIANHYEETTIL